MNLERSLTIVRGYRPVEALPLSASDAELTATVAVVLPTYRSDAVDMVLDHPLWLACMRAVSEFVRADTSDVLAWPERRFLEFLRRRRASEHLGSVEKYGARLLSDLDAPDWKLVIWRKLGKTVAVAACEPWYRTGGPSLYHDSYTTCIFIGSAAADGLVATLERTAREAGACVETVLGRFDG